MTPGLEELLQQYGFLVVTLSQLKRERPGSQYKSLDEYYESLGMPLPDEHAIVVRISKDGEIHFLDEGEHNVEFRDDQGIKRGIVKVWELPEGEFWFFKAFRPALFDLDKDLPSFLYEMGVIYAYALFEGYLAEILRARFRQHPQQLGGKSQLTYEQVFEAPSRDALIDGMINREIRDLMYSSILDVLRRMRKKLGFRMLSEEYDTRVYRLSLLRNCYVHNRGLVDKKLAAIDPSLREGVRIVLTEHDVTDAVNMLRKFAYQIDRSFLDPKASSS